MTFWMALMAPLLFVQEPADDLRKEIDKLKKQTIELQERLSLLEQASVEDAQTIQRLRQVVKLLESNAPSAAPTEPKNNSGTPVKPDFKGPGASIKGKLVYVDVKNNFITLGIGKREKVEIGYKFEIYRETYEAGGESKLTRLGIGTVEKFMGQDSMTKIIINEGNIADMRVDDIAVAVRKISDTPAPNKDDPKSGTPGTPEKAEAPKDGVYRITGRTGIGGNGGYVVNYGQQLGAVQTQLLYVYKDGQFKAKLRMDKVDKTHSMANIVDGSVVLPPEVDDQVYLKELHKSLAGKVALSDDKRGVLAVDLRQRDGIKPGMHCEVRRLGQKIGTVLITEVQAWGSWAKPDGDLKIEQIQKGDFVEVVDEK